MMAKDYDATKHTYVSARVPGREWDMLSPVLHHTGTRVWLKGTRGGFKELGGLVQVRDGLDGGFDQYGTCVVSVPVEWCQFHTTKEATSIEARTTKEGRARG